MLALWKTIKSGSSGNAYIIETKDEVLLIEAGRKFKDVTKALDFDIRGIKAVCVSHVHQDHVKYRTEYELSGIFAYCPWETTLRHRNFGHFSVQAFQVPHDVDNFGFYIKHKDLGKLIYVTDCEFVPQNFKKLEVDHIVCEVNYQNEYVSEDLLKKDRVLQTHMAEKTAIDFVKANQTENLKTVTLIHYSETNCDIEQAVKRMQEAVGDSVRVDYARAGESLEL